MSRPGPGLLSRLRPDWYLVLIVGMVALASVAPARGAAAPAFGAATQVAVALVFFLHGARLSREAVIRGLAHWRLHFLVLASTFGLFPIICLVLAVAGPPALAAGIVFLGCLPSTIQSSIGFTAIARGNVPAAIAAASASNLLGVVLTPMLVALTLHATGSASPRAIQAIVLQLLAPFMAGQLLRPWIGTWVSDNAPWLVKVDRGAILLVVYTAFSSAVVNGVWRRLGLVELLWLAAICAVLLSTVLWVTVSAARALRFDKADEIAIVFCGSKKSLASGVPMAAALFPAATAGLALLPLMLFHQIQLMACAVIAQRYANRRDSSA